MSVLQIIKDLLSEQDVAWGDSDTTFNRQTHKGGTVAVNYLDSKSIPANTLGGYIDTHLHTQNTDTGTTATTFKVASGGNYAELSASGQTGDRTFTFPISASQRLIGATDLLSVANAKGASLVGVEDTGLYFSSATVEGALVELAQDVASVSTYRGYKRGFTLGYSAVTTITINGGMWNHMGTTTQDVYTNSQLSFILGSAGSNSGSTNLGANELHYIYIDDSAVVTSGSALLTASEFLNSTSIPAYSNAKAGWYSGNDRCVGAIRTNVSSQVSSFYVRSGHFMCYNVGITAFSSAAAPTVVQALDLSGWMPVFSTQAKLDVYPATEGTVYSFGITGGAVYNVYYTAPYANGSGMLDVFTDTSQSVDWKGSAASLTAILITGYLIDEL